MFLRGDVTMHAFRKTVWDVFEQLVLGGSKTMLSNLMNISSDIAGR